MTSKNCTMCNESKNINQFGMCTLKTGTIRIRSVCNKCRALKQREYYNLTIDKTCAQTICECGSLQHVHNMKRHVQTNKHKKYLEANIKK